MWRGGGWRVGGWCGKEEGGDMKGWSGGKVEVKGEKEIEGWRVEA